MFSISRLNRHRQTANLQDEYTHIFIVIWLGLFAPAVAPVPGLASQVPPAAGHGTRLWERDFESLGLPKKRTGMRAVLLEDELVGTLLH